MRASACALSAKHLHRLCQRDLASAPPLWDIQNSCLPQTIGAADLGFESVRFYDEAIHHLKGALVSSVARDRPEEMFAAVAILCIYELTDAPSTGWRAHLSALSFLYQRAPGGMSPSSVLPESLLHIPCSVFWSLVRQDCLSACKFDTNQHRIVFSFFPFSSPVNYL